MPRWLIVVVGSTSVFFTVVACIYFFGPQTMLTFTARRIGRQLPDVTKVPVELPDRSISSEPGTRLSYFGYAFEIPWNDLDPEKDRAAGPIHVTAFRSGDALWFSIFPPRDLIQEVMKTGKMTPDAFRSVYGDAALQSDYAFRRLMLDTVPSQITPFIARRDAARATILLTIKAIAMPQTDSGLYLIQTADRKGFQYGDPRGRPKKIVDDLFSDDDGVEFIFFRSGNPNAPSITQEEINRVIQSLHKLPDTRSASNR
jgi:hypothetical protein